MLIFLDNIKELPLTELDENYSSDSEIGALQILYESSSSFNAIEKDFLIFHYRNKLENSNYLNEGFFEGVKSFINKIINFFKDLWKKIVGFFKKLFGIEEKATQDMQKTVKQEEAKAIVKEAVNNMTSVSENQREEMKRKIDQTFKSAGDGIKETRKLLEDVQRTRDEAQKFLDKVKKVREEEEKQKRIKEEEERKDRERALKIAEEKYKNYTFESNIAITPDTFNQISRRYTIEDYTKEFCSANEHRALNFGGGLFITESLRKKSEAEANMAIVRNSLSGNFSVEMIKKNVFKKFFESSKKTIYLSSLADLIKSNAFKEIDRITEKYLIEKENRDANGVIEFYEKEYKGKIDLNNVSEEQLSEMRTHFAYIKTIKDARINFAIAIFKVKQEAKKRLFALYKEESAKYSSSK